MILLYAFFVLTFLNAFKDIAIKKWLKNITAGAMTGLTALVMIIISIPFLSIEGIPQHLDHSFIWIVLGGGVFYYFGKFFNFTALSLGDISLISPMKGLVTISVIFSSVILLGEWVSWGGGIGIFLIFFGTYFLTIEKTHTHILAPILAIWKNPGSRIYLLSVLFYGFTVTFDRMGVQGSSIWIWTIAMNGIMFLMSIPDLYRERRTIVDTMQKFWKILVLILLLHAFIYVSQMYIVSQVIAPYTSAFKAASSLFAVMFGGWFFKEKDLMKRFIAAIIIFAGVICVGFFG